MNDSTIWERIDRLQTLKNINKKASGEIQSFVLNICLNNLKYIKEHYAQFTDKILRKEMFFVASALCEKTEIIDFIHDMYEIDINSSNDRGDTSLLYASAHNKLHVIKHLIDKYSLDINVCNLKGTNTMMAACYKNRNVDVIEYFIKKRKMNVALKNNNGNTSLTLACACNSLDVVKYLVEKCISNINDRTKRNNNCLLMACRWNNVDVVQYLIEEKNMNINHQNNQHRNAILMACHRKKTNLEVVKYLVEKVNANVNDRDHAGDTCLILACRSNHNIDVIKYLIEEKKVDVNEIDDDDETCLEAACYDKENNNFQKIQYLLVESNINLSQVCNDIIPTEHIKKILSSLEKVNNYPKLHRIMESLWVCPDPEDYGVSTLSLNDNIIKKYKLKDPYDEPFNDFVKMVDQTEKKIFNIKYPKPIEKSVEANVEANVEGGVEKKVKNDYTKMHELLFKHNEKCYYGNRNVVYSAIHCLNEMDCMFSFNDTIVLEGHLPECIINEYIDSIFTSRFDLNIVQPELFKSFIRFIDQYPSVSVSIDRMEMQIINYIDNNKQTVQYDNFLKEICLRYRLKHIYARVHNTMYE